MVVKAVSKRMNYEGVMDYANLHVYRLIWSLLVLEIARKGLHPSQSLLVVTMEVYCCMIALGCYENGNSIQKD